MTTLRLTVVIPTYQRQTLLAAGLPMVLDQARSLSSDELPVSADVLVIDNDPSETASPVVESIAGADLRYVVEATPGIVAARNRALDELIDRDLLVFIDDDEQPRPQWLAQLVRTYLETGAAAVAGRVVSQYDRSAVDHWVAAGDLFRRKQWRTGTQMSVAATNNLLLDLRQVRALGLRFDPRLGMAGGEDSLLTRQLVRRGGRIVACAESIADDHVVTERLTRDWLLRRAFSQGNVRVTVDLLLATSPLDRVRARVRGVSRGGLRVSGGLARAAFGWLAGSTAHRSRGMRTAYRGFGMLAAAAGRRTEEYARS